MITIDCPWCEAEMRLELGRLHEPETAFECAACGTSVRFVDEPRDLELAA